MSRIIELRALILENFKRHRQLEVQFSRTLTVIRGPNYVGKSSVLEAVFFALFGLSAIPGSKTSTPSKGTSNCKVILELSIDGQQVLIERTLTTAMAVVEGEVKASGTTQVSEWAEEQIGMEKASVLLLAYSSQGETQALMTVGAAELNRIIEKVSGADDVDYLAGRASGESQRYSKLTAENFTSRKSSEIETEMKESFQLSEKAKIAKAGLEAKKQGLDESLKNIIQEITSVSALISKQRLQDNVLLQFKARLEPLEAEVERLKDLANAPVPDVEGALRVSKMMRADYDTEREKRAEAANLLTASERADKKIKAKQQGIDERQEVTELLRIATESYDHAVSNESSLNATVATLSAEKKGLESKQKELSDSLSKASCYACGRAFDEHSPEDIKSHLEQIVYNLKETKNCLDNALNSLSKVNEEKSKLAHSVRNYQSKVVRREELEELKEEIEAWGLLNEKLQVLVDSFEGKDEPKLDPSYQEAYINARERAAAIQQASLRYKCIQAEVAELRTKVTETESSVKVNTVALEVTLRELQEKKEKQLGENSELIGLISRLDHEIKVEEEESKALQSLLLEVKSKEELRAKYERLSTRYGEFSKWLRVNKSKFMQETWEQLMAITSEFASMCTSGAIQSVERDETGSFWFYEEGERLPVRGCASGGQRSIMGVGLRLALSSLMPAGCEFVVLDEPSAELNDEHAAALTAAIATQGRQVILVTHRDGDEVAAERVIVLD